jgi:hypothetical protein
VELVTTKVTTGDVEGLTCAALGATNRAVSWCDPAANLDVVTDAVPLLTATGLPM